MFKETESFELLNGPLQDFHHSGLIEPCSCCSPVFQQISPADWSALTNPSHWEQQGQNRNIYTPTTTVLLVNAKILTMDNEMTEASAIAFKDARILEVGDEKALRESADPDVEIIDCEGRTILPGFIEPHFHFFPCASLERFENVGPFRFDTVDEALARLKEVADGADPNEWVMGRQFDPSLQEGADLLTRDMLDTVSTTNPVFVYNASLHFAYCNSKALEAAGITRDTPDDPNSPYGRDEDGEPNGVLIGGVAIGSVIKHNEAARQLDLAATSIDVVARANEKGVTTFCDQATGMMRGTKEISIYQALGQSSQMTARLRYSLSYGIADRWDEFDIACGDGDEIVRCTHWKIVSDGSNQGFSGLQREPYLYRDDVGLPYVDADVLKDMVRDRAEKGWALAIHANGDKAIDNVLDAYEEAFNDGLLTNTPCRIEHCSILHDDQIERIAAMGLSPSFLIGHVYYWGQAMRDKVFGHAKACLLDRTAACEEKGIRWTLHSDEPVSEMGPLRCIENAVTRKMWKEPESQLAPEECISVETAIRSMTRDAAWQCHSDHEVGTLEPGKFADLVILDADPREVDPNTISDIRVLETWMGGRRVYSSQ